MNDLPDPGTLLNRKEAADYLRGLRCSVRTANRLAQLASSDEGPPYYMDGGRALYSKPELDQWRMQRLRRIVKG